MQWSGLDDFLTAHNTDKVTKQQILDHLAQNDVQVEQVTLGGRGENLDSPKIAADKKRLEDAGYQVVKDDEDAYNVYVTKDSTLPVELGDLSPPMRKSLENIQEFLATSHNIGPKFGPDTHLTMSLPGGENYREVLLRLGDKTKKWEVFNPVDGKAVASFDTELEAKKEANVRNMNGGSFDYGLRDAKDNPDRFTAGHFNEPNVLAHLRLDDRTSADGKKTLFVEEMQSDWAQKGRREGFSGDNPLSVKEIEPGKWVLVSKATGEQIGNREYSNQAQALDQARIAAETATGRGHIPRAPFIEHTSDWTELAVKRILRMAAEEGYDRVAWTTGEQQAERYDLSKYVDEIRATKSGDKTYVIKGFKNNSEVLNKQNVDEKDLPEVIGKDVADKIIEKAVVTPSNQTDWKGWVNLSGLDLKVGGEGMKGFYDKIVPATVAKVGKKWGVKIGETDIGAGGVGGKPLVFKDLGNNSYGSDLTTVLVDGKPELARVYVGEDVVSLDIKDVGIYNLKHDIPGPTDTVKYYVEKAWTNPKDGFWDEIGNAPEEGFDAADITPQTQASELKTHSIDITPAMRASIMQEGFPQFKTEAAGGGPGKVSVTLDQIKANLPDKLASKVVEDNGTFYIPTPRGHITIQPTGDITLNWHALETGHGPGAAEAVKSEAKRVTGMTVPINGGQLIQIVHEGVLPHEIGHVFMDHFATAKELSVIESSLARVSEKSGRSIKEEFADGFSDWFKHDREVRENETLIGSVYRRIYEFFQGVYQTFKPSIEGVYREGARRGFERPAANSTGGEPVAQYQTEPFNAPRLVQPKTHEYPQAPGGIETVPVEPVIPVGESAPGKYTISAKSTPDGDIFAATMRYFGQKIGIADLAHTAGMPEGAKVFAKVFPGNVEVYGELFSDNPKKGKIGEMVRVFHRSKPDGSGPYVENYTFSLDKTGKGEGTRIFADEVQRAADAGFKYIETYAGHGGVDETKEPPAPQLNGYYTWARLGYDGKVHGPDGPTQVSELMKTPEGRAWWRDNGHSFTGRFDLTPGSTSRRVLEEYLRLKEARGRGKEASTPSAQNP